jgi:hypothetical protein
LIVRIQRYKYPSYSDKRIEVQKDRRMKGRKIQGQKDKRIRIRGYKNIKG